MKNSYDAIVIGDGIFGLLFAYQLNVRNLKVLVVSKSESKFLTSASLNSAAFIHYYSEEIDDVDLVLRSSGAYLSLVEESYRSGFGAIYYQNKIPRDEICLKLRDNRIDIRCESGRFMFPYSGKNLSNRVMVQDNFKINPFGFLSSLQKNLKSMGVDFFSSNSKLKIAGNEGSFSHISFAGDPEIFKAKYCFLALGASWGNVETYEMISKLIPVFNIRFENPHSIEGLNVNCENGDFSYAVDSHNMLYFTDFEEYLSSTEIENHNANRNNLIKYANIIKNRFSEYSAEIEVSIGNWGYDGYFKDRKSYKIFKYDGIRNLAGVGGLSGKGFKLAPALTEDIIESLCCEARKDSVENSSVNLELNEFII
ncbi:FAD-dependent oxidoreductase [Leptospira alexanderi]|uniref:FAD-dependent oxidoreductase n=1 Tax=Leptospira alexanderi TaxID=100053 RepID=UPI000990D7F6|nr:FAD-dependent oxidoreductase [Leptospira alexanderi]